MNMVKTSEEVFQSLLLGNERFVDGKRTFPNQDAARIKELSAGQNPSATIISCSDSRVTPELVLDQGLGDLFVIRVAGNICGTSEMATIEFGVDVLKTPLLVVMGHTQCGAVTAVLENTELNGNISDLVDNILPATMRVEYEGPVNHEVVYDAVKENVWFSVETIINRSEIVRNRLLNGDLQLIGSIYHIESGKVEWLGKHARQKELIIRAKYS